MRLFLVALAFAGTVGLTACGGSASTSKVPSTKPAATASATAGSRTATGTPTQAAPTSAPGTTTPAPSATFASAGETGIEGIVTIGPTCPVQRIDSPCPDRPYEATISVLDSAGRKVAEARSGADGRFRLLLPAGTYTLRPEASGAFPHAREQSVAVENGRITPVQIVFDSGIR